MNLPWTLALGAVLCAGSLRLSGESAANGSVRWTEPRQAQGAAFLTRIRLADPDYRLILMACLKGNELNLLLSRHVTPGEIPILVKGLTGQLAQSFPGEALSVVAFRPIVPLKEAAIARLDPATGQVSYWGEPTVESVAPPQSVP